MRTQKIIPIAFMITLASGALAFYLPTPYRKKTLWGATHANGDFPPIKFFLGAGIAFFGISAVGEFKPGLAGPFAALVMTTAGLFNGVPALEYLMQTGGTPAPAPTPVVTPVGTINVTPSPSNGAIPPLTPLPKTPQGSITIPANNTQSE